MEEKKRIILIIASCLLLVIGVVTVSKLMPAPEEKTDNKAIRETGRSSTVSKNITAAPVTTAQTSSNARYTKSLKETAWNFMLLYWNTGDSQEIKTYMTEKLQEEYYPVDPERVFVESFSPEGKDTTQQLKVTYTDPIVYVNIDDVDKKTATVMIVCTRTEIMPENQEDKKYHYMFKAKFVKTDNVNWKCDEIIQEGQFKVDGE